MFASRRFTARAVAGLASATLLLGLAACGGDDDSSDTTAAAATTAAPETTAAAATTAAPETTAAAATTAAPETTAAAETTVPGAADVDIDAFCQAELAAEAATSSEDPSAAGPAFDALLAVAPPEVKPAVEAVITAASSGDTDSDEFNDNYATMITFVKDNCGFGDLEVTTKEYEFGGVPPTLDAGPVVVTNNNIGTEFHEVLVLRVNDGVTESVEEIVALPEEEALTKASVLGVAFAAPGATGYAAMDLEPGHYATICFLPVGATPENMAAIDAGTFEGAPHFTQGMLTEFDVE